MKSALYSGLLFTVKEKDNVISCDYTSLALHKIVSCKGLCVSVEDWRKVEGGSDSTERSVCWRGGWYKDSLFCPWRRVTFASGLICILVHCAGMLLLLLVGLYSPDKTQPIKGFWASAVLPLPFAPCLYSAPFFLILGFFIPCPPLFLILDPFSMLPISFFLSLL